MNEINNELPTDIKNFFNRLKNYLDTDLYFYGSVTRSDYVPGKSDIDVAIFTDNEYSTMSKLQHFLHVKRSDFDKVVWKLNSTMIYGYKIKVDNINGEIAIYNNDFKKVLLDEFTKPIRNSTILTGTILYLLKLFYYKIPIIPQELYVKYKRFVLNEMMGKKESVFFVLKQK
jgi:predicted nucleotidyltransferase